jgi:hypothetical protein
MLPQGAAAAQIEAAKQKLMAGEPLTTNEHLLLSVIYALTWLAERGADVSPQSSR